MTEKHGPLAMCVSAPVVLMQDVGRFYANAAGRPWLAALSDGVWAIASLVLFAFTFVPGPRPGPLPIIAGWLLAGALALGAILVKARLVPAYLGWRVWLRQAAGHRTRFGLDATIGAVGSFGLLGIAGAILGADSLAALRGAGALLGPVAVFVSAIQVAVIPELHRHELSSSAVWARLRTVTLPLSVGALVLGLSAPFWPVSLGRGLLGDSWSAVRQIVPITAAEYFLLCWYAATAAALTIDMDSGWLLRMRVVLISVSAVLVSVGAVVFMDTKAVSVGLLGGAGVAVWFGRRRVRASFAGRHGPIGGAAQERQ